MMRLVLKVGLAWMALITAWPVAAMQVHAFLDRDTVHLGDSVTLNVSVKGAMGVSGPDFSVLTPDFVLQDTSRNQSITINNGKVDKTVLFAVALQPRRVGTLTIPSLDVDGSNTTPLSLTVLPADTQGQASASDNVFIETSVEPKQVYVGQQALLTVTLYYDGANLQGQLDDPVMAHADVQKLGKELQYQSQRGSRMYRVVERRYAVIPRQAGDLTIAPVNFQGQLNERRGNFGYFRLGQEVSARSGAIVLAVRPKPTTVTQGEWLPARNLSLSMQGLPADGKATVGVPFTLTLTEQAEGLSADLLPALTLPDIDGAEVYPDEAQTSSGDDGKWLEGKRVRKFAIVPIRRGELHIPAVAVSWWDVGNDKQAMASTVAHVLQVAGTAAGNLATAPASGDTGSSGRATDGGAANGPHTGPALGAASNTAHLWQTIAFSALALWLLTLLGGWLLWRRRRGSRNEVVAPTDDMPSRAAAKAAFMAASDARALEHALLAWARAERPQLDNFEHLAGQLDDARQLDMIARLQANRFAGHAASVDPTAVHRAFKRGLAWRSPEQKTAVSGLPPLYP